MANTGFSVYSIGVRATNLPQLGFQLSDVHYVIRPGSERIWAVLHGPRNKSGLIGSPPHNSQRYVDITALPGITRVEVTFEGTDFDAVIASVCKAAAYQGDLFLRAAGIRVALRPVLTCIDGIFRTRCSQY